MKTLQTVREHIYWSKPKEDVKKLCYPCDACSTPKKPKKCNQRILHRYNLEAHFTFQEQHLTLQVLYYHHKLPLNTSWSSEILSPSCLKHNLQQTKKLLLSRRFQSRNRGKKIGTSLQIHTGKRTKFLSPVFKELYQFLGKGNTQGTSVQH